MALTARGRAMRWLTNHRGITEQPPGSNRDNRKDGITAAQKRLGSWLVGTPWCGTWACNAALVGGVKMAHPERWASVAFIEDDARRGVNGFRDWRPSPVARTGKVWRNVYRGDLVVLFGRGVHVETIRSCAWIYRKLGLIRTEGGNTSPGDGSQSNGGWAGPRLRRISDIHGIARVRYGH